MNFQNGDIIAARPNIARFATHYGILLIKGTNISVLHNTPFRGPVKDPLNVFLKKRKLISFRHTALNQLSYQSIMDRFENACQQKYHLLKYNCEHFIDCMLDQPQRSEQVAFWTKIGVAVLAYRYFKNK